MAAAGRYVGVVMSEREAGLPAMDEDERHLLFGRSARRSRWPLWHAR
jgi:hypothetical protein